MNRDSYSPSKDQFSWNPSSTTQSNTSDTFRPFSDQQSSFQSSYSSPNYNTATPSGFSDSPSSFQNQFSDSSNQQEPAQPEKKERKFFLADKKRTPFHEFINDKVGAFAYFSKNQDTANYINQSDVDEFTRLFVGYNKNIMTSYYTTCLFSFFSDLALKRKFLVYRMTSRNTLPKFLLKYWILPEIVSSMFDAFYFKQQFVPGLEGIANKYSFQEPVFQQAYEKENTEAQKPKSTLSRYDNKSEKAN